jgi:hypothetical protein
MAMSRNRKIANAVVGIAAGSGLLLYWNNVKSKLAGVALDQHGQNEVAYFLYIGVGLIAAGVIYLLLALKHRA